MCRLYALTSFYIIVSSCLAQTGQFYMGAQSSGMAHANINATNPWSVFNNPAGLGYISEPTAMISYQNRLNMAAFQTLGLGMIWPKGKLVPGLSVYRFGDDIFNQQKIGFSLGSKIQIVSLGMGVHLIQNRFSELGNFNALSLDFGGVAEVIKGIRLGAHIFNLNQASFNENQFLPVTMRFGLSYVPSDNFILTSELEKQLDLSNNYKFGLTYQITQWVMFQTGFATLPRSLSFGLGFKVRDWILNYSFTSLEAFGSNQEISLSRSLLSNAKD